MDRISGATVAANLFGAGKNGFTAGNAATGVPATVVTDTWLNGLQEEVIGVIEGAGLAPSAADNTLLRQAIAKMIAAAATAIVIQQATFAPGIANGNPVRWDAGNNRFALAQADGTTNDLAVGFADVTNAAVYCFGRSRAGLLAGLTPGARYYLSAAGALSAAAAADAIYAGIALAADTLFIDIDPGAAGFKALAYEGIGQGLEDDGTGNLRVKLNGASLSRSASGMGINTANSNPWSAAQTCSNNILTDGTTITPNLAGAPEGYVVLAGNRILGFPTGLQAGQRQRFVFDIWQDTAGSRTLAYAWCYLWSNGSAGVLSTTALSRDKLFGDVAYYNQSAVTISIAAPGVVTWAGHGLQTGYQLQLTTTGALPTGLSASTTYYVIAVDANTFRLATSLANAAAGTAIATSGSQSGTHTATACAIDLTLPKGFK